jgi:UDP-glucose 4-epimerase
MNVLVTGGTGFIGSHTAVELMAENHEIVVVDSLINSSKTIIKSLEQITGKPIRFTELDIRSTIELTELMTYHKIDAVIHFAALKAVGESIEKPLEYYQNNINGLLSVLEAMNLAKVSKLIFSSSATVYGDPDVVPITEEAQLKPATNPYGATKQMAEQIISDVCKSSSLQAVLLRYFNPIGAHSSGLIGELPKGIPNNLVPFVTQAAAGLRDKLTVHGDDYDTPDGSGVRDYIHVVDLAKAHVKSLDYINSTKDDVTILNIGTGEGTSVLEVIKTFEKVNDTKVPYTVGPRRPGDIASCYASSAKAENIIGWKAELSLEQALKDAWKWQQSLNSSDNTK